MLVRDIARSGLTVFLLIWIILYIQTRKKIYILLMLSYIVINYIQKWLKQLSITYLPYSVASRPLGAGNNNGCSFIIINESSSITETKSGMPSGHSMLAMFIFIVTTYMIQSSNYDNHIKLFSYVALTMFTFIVLYSRIYWENCHTILQVLIGSIIGIFLGVVFIRIIKKYNVRL